MRNAGPAVHVLSDPQSAGAAAGAAAAVHIREAITTRGHARILVATGNSQVDLIEHLVQEPIDWSVVDVLHLDEYVGISANHPASFRYWIKTRLANKARPRAVHYIQGDAADLQAELNRYTRLLAEDFVDVAFVGFGENGHIAFNDPGVADRNDPAAIKRVALDVPSRLQQVGEGHFPDLASVPEHALTLTCPALLAARRWVCCVPEKRKAAAVAGALEGPISEDCPASFCRLHPRVEVFLDEYSASLLSR
ncbi:MAG TPA: 6-phosphogluconolactonase [Bryobacteraceae bacterium]|nr:6-phosphogluconolactonase [Bryobacteraceae bacterium]